MRCKNENIEYIYNVNIDDIPWNRLPGPYGTCEDFPKWLEQIASNDTSEVQKTSDNIAMNVEHQSTLWAATPFAMIFLRRILIKALKENNKETVSVILNLYKIVFDTADGVWEMDHAEEFPHFKDLLLDENVLPETDDEDEKEELLELFFEDVNDRLFYSYFFYSWFVLWYSIKNDMDDAVEFDEKIMVFFDKLFA